MNIEPKISSANDIDKLKRCYIENKMSTVDIEKKSQDIFGFYVSRGTIYKTMQKHGIMSRNKSVSVTRAKSTLDIDVIFLTEDIIEWVDGLLLGDGFINFGNEKYQGSRFRIDSSEKQWVEYGITRLTPYNPCPPNEYQKIDERHPNQIWTSQTKTHPDIVHQAERWYSGTNQTKVVPPDVRITPTSLLLWYLGDGSLTYIKDCNTYIVRFATCAFSIDEVENILMPKLTALGLECSRDKSKNDIRILAASIGRFFDIIGHKSPISCYDHKFAIPDWLRLIRLSDIVENDKQKWMAQYYYKTGQIECSKSPGGKMLLFTKEQADKLRLKLSFNYPT